jgi:beta-galactosidase
VDLIQMGVGGNDSWSVYSAPLEKYQVPAKNYSYSFYMFPAQIQKEKVPDIAFGIRF